MRAVDPIRTLGWLGIVRRTLPHRALVSLGLFSCFDGLAEFGMRRGQAMKRREFITLLGGAVTAWPLAARAQQPVIGLLSSRSPAVDTLLIAIIRQALNETGLVEGQNVTFDYRWAEGRYDRLAGLAADLVRRQVAVIITMGGESSALF
jgi:hypothetical protein